MPGPLQTTLLLSFEEREAEEEFCCFYDVYTEGTTCAANRIVIVSGIALCLKAWWNQWDSFLAVRLCVVPVIVAAVIVAMTMSTHKFSGMRYYLFAFFKVYGATQANYICAALLPNKVMTASSFASSCIFLSPLAGLTFYSLGYFIPFRRGIALHLIATILAMRLNAVYCKLATQEPPAAQTALLAHRSMDVAAGLMWCGAMLPADPVHPDANSACLHLLDMLCVLLGFVSVNLAIFMSELKARIKFSVRVASRGGVRFCGVVITEAQFQSYAGYFGIAILQVAGIVWYATGFRSVYSI
jgi:hypothetical protein